MGGERGGGRGGTLAREKTRPKADDETNEQKMATIEERGCAPAPQCAPLAPPPSTLAPLAHLLWHLGTLIRVHASRASYFTASSPPRLHVTSDCALCCLCGAAPRPSSVFRLPSSIFRLPSSIFRLPSSSHCFPFRRRATKSVPRPRRARRWDTAALAAGGGRRRRWRRRLRGARTGQHGRRGCWWWWRTDAAARDAHRDGAHASGRHRAGDERGARRADARAGGVCAHSYLITRDGMTCRLS